MKEAQIQSAQIQSAQMKEVQMKEVQIQSACRIKSQKTGRNVDFYRALPWQA
ncbi:hypothetical protein ACSAZL_08215 [Methanosarcina sp. T3]|uniref:hypothetical protein n=1 Tax=Methanosarcina sp. T3 TaxID=3439062 RepID=UPI003F87CD6C